MSKDPLVSIGEEVVSLNGVNPPTGTELFVDFTTYYLPPGLNAQKTDLLKRALLKLFPYQYNPVKPFRQPLRPCNNDEKDLVLASLKHRFRLLSAQAAKFSEEEKANPVLKTIAKKAGALHEILRRLENPKFPCSATGAAIGDEVGAEGRAMDDERVKELLRQFLFFIIQSQTPIEGADQGISPKDFILQLERTRGDFDFDGYLDKLKSKHVELSPIVIRILQDIYEKPDLIKGQINAGLQIHLKKYLLEITNTYLGTEQNDWWKEQDLANIRTLDDFFQLLLSYTSTLEAKYAECESELAALKAQVSALEREKEALRLDVGAKEGQIRQLTVQIAALQAQIEGATSASQRETGARQQALDAATTERDRLQADLRACMERSQGMTAEIARLNAALAEKDRELQGYAGLRGQIEGLQGQLGEAQAAAAAAREEATGARTAADAERAAKTQCEQRLAAAEAAAAEAAGLRDQLNARIAELSAQLEAAGDVEGLRAELEAAVAARDAAIAERDAALARATAAEAAQNEAEARAAAAEVLAQRQGEISRAKFNSAATTFDEAKQHFDQRIAETEAARIAAEERAAAAEAALRAANERAEAAEAALAEANQRVANATGSANARIREAEAGAAAAKQEAARAQEALAAANAKAERLEAEAAQAKQQAAAASTATQEATAQKEAAEKAAQAAEARATAAEAAQASANAAAAAARQTTQAAEATIVALNNQIRDVLQTIKAKLDRQDINELADGVAALIKRIDDCEAEKARLNAEVASLRADNEELAEQIKALTLERDEARATLAKSKLSLTEAQAAKKAVDASLAQQQRSLADLQAQLQQAAATSGTQADKLRAQITAITAERDHLAQQQQEKDEYVQAASDEVRATQAAVAAKQKELDEANARIAELERSHAAEKASLEAQKAAAVAAAEESRRALEAENNANKEALAAARAEVASATEALAAAKAQVGELTQAHQRQLEEAQAALQAAVAKERACEERAAALERQLAESRAALATAETAVGEIREGLAAVKQKYESQQSGFIERIKALLRVLEGEPAPARFAEDEQENSAWAALYARIKESEDKLKKCAAEPTAALMTQMVYRTPGSPFVTLNQSYCHLVFFVSYLYFTHFPPSDANPFQKQLLAALHSVFDPKKKDSFYQLALAQKDELLERARDPAAVAQPSQGSAGAAGSARPRSVSPGRAAAAAPSIVPRQGELDNRDKQVFLLTALEALASILSIFTYLSASKDKYGFYVLKKEALSEKKIKILRVLEKAWIASLQPDLSSRLNFLTNMATFIQGKSPLIHPAFNLNVSIYPDTDRPEPFPIPKDSLVFTYTDPAVLQQIKEKTAGGDVQELKTVASVQGLQVFDELAALTNFVRDGRDLAPMTAAAMAVFDQDPDTADDRVRSPVITLIRNYTFIFPNVLYLYIFCMKEYLNTISGEGKCLLPKQLQNPSGP